MGLKKVVKKVAGAVGLGGGGGGGGAGGPPPPDLSELEALKSRQQKAAQDFRKNMAGMQSEQDRASRMTAREELAQNLNQIKSGASARGLLYSGLRQSDEAKVAQGAAQNIAAQSAQTASRLEEQARGLEDQAAATGISLQMAKQGLANDAFATALQNRQARNQAIGAGLGAVGQIGGAYFGRGR